LHHDGASTDLKYLAGLQDVLQKGVVALVQNNLRSAFTEQTVSGLDNFNAN
jgi:hypothetical protein